MKISDGGRILCNLFLKFHFSGNFSRKAVNFIIFCNNYPIFAY